MPRVDFTDEHRIEPRAGSNFDRLKLGTGDKARLLLIEKPIVEFEHTIQVPQILNGKPVEEEIERKDGSGTFTVYKKDFVSRLLCTGDFETMRSQGVDPENCVVCKYTVQPENKGRIKGPQPRYAMHVVRYKTKGGTYDVTTPFQVDLPVWSFSQTVFNKLHDLRKEWEDSGGFKEHDLLLVCKNAQFQQYEFNIAPNAAWKKDEATKALVKEVFEGNQIEDLALACGSRKDERFVLDDLKKVDEAYGLIEDRPAAELDMASLDEGIGALLGDEDEPKEQAEAEAPASGTASFDDLFN